MRSDMEWLSLVGPLERLGHGAIEVFDEGQHLVPEIVSGGEVADRRQKNAKAKHVVDAQAFADDVDARLETILEESRPAAELLTQHLPLLASARSDAEILAVLG